MILTCLVLLLCVLGCRHGGQAAAEKEDEKEEPDVNVRVKPAENRTLAEKVAGLGRCEAIPQRFAVLTQRPKAEWSIS